MGVLPTGIAWVAIGGALGAVGRHWVGHAFSTSMPNHPHRATITVNILGSLLIGFVGAWLAARESTSLNDSSAVRHGLMVGLLGAFTTFSAFSLDAIKLFQSGKATAAAGYILLSVATCLACASLSFWAGSKLFHTQQHTTQPLPAHSPNTQAPDDAGID